MKIILICLLNFKLACDFICNAHAGQAREICLSRSYEFGEKTLKLFERVQNHF